MNLSWKLGRIAGIDLYLHPTFLLLLVFAGAGRGGMMAVLLTIAAFGCVLLHELGHALTAKLVGIPTLDITLYPIGGVARLARMPRKPGPELLITAAGPLVNLVLAGGFALAGLVATGFAAAFCSTLTTINLILFAFNLIPAFPMDGGRILRALLSEWLGRLRATAIAARLGKMLAMGFGAYSVLSGSWIQVFIAVFVYLAANAELRRVEEEDGDDRPSRRDRDDDGIWTAPPGHRWVRVGQGAWQLAPIPVTSSWPR